MKSEIYSSIKKIVITTISILISMLFCYVIEYNMVYRTIKVKASDVNVLEYGSANYNIKNLVENVDGESISVKKNIDVKKIGEQELVIEVKKGDVVKDVPVKIEVKDTSAPEIKLKEENISLTVGEDFDILNNLDSVSDIVDGNLQYQQKEIVNEEVDTNYYTVYGEVNNNVSGVYPVVVKAVDKYGNEASRTYNVEVKQKYVSFMNNITYHNNYVATGDTNQLVNLAYSLVGSPYVAGGASPAGFDCSGFVYYLYSQIGISVSRSSSTQIYDGVAVSYDAAQPGDILSWGYVDGVPTHSALYIGNGQMIHATNPRQGVIVSDVAAWTRGSGTRVIGVRRI